MADNRIIRSAIRITTKEGVDEVFGPGREDELEAVMTKEQLGRFQESGALEGDWKAGGKAEPADSEASTKKK